MLRAYKFRLYPNREQKEYFAKCFGCARFNNFSTTGVGTTLRVWVNLAH